MDYTQITEVLVQVLVAVLGILATTLYPKFKAWINGKLTEQQLLQIIQYIKLFVEAAEQQLKDADPTGEIRKQYVVDQLSKMGIQVNEQINAIIESQVLQLQK